MSLRALLGVGCHLSHDSQICPPNLPAGILSLESTPQKGLIFPEGEDSSLSLSAGALEIVSRWALEKRGSAGCESLWKPLSELFVAASLIFHATRY